MPYENDNNHSMLVFPCDFTIKIFGKSTEEFESAVLTIVHEFVPNLSEGSIQSRMSENGNYHALSITVHVESKNQLDNIYQALSSCKHVLMAL